MKHWLITSYLLLLIGLSYGKDAYRIEISIKNYDQDVCILGNYFADKQYIKDTTEINRKGSFVFKGDEPLEGGIYLAILPPNNQYFEFLVDDKNQKFEIEVDANDLKNSIKIKGSSVNTDFLNYLNYISTQREKGGVLKDQYETASDDEKTRLSDQLKALDKAVKDHQKKAFKQHKNSILGLIIGASLEVKIPTTPEGEDERMFQYRYYKKHYFDHTDLSDPRLIRTPLMYKKIDFYTKNLTPKHPDSINVTIDYILNKIGEKNERAYQYYLIKFLNEYANSKIVGMDAVYVHIVENYYMKGKAPWTEEAQLKKITENAIKLKPILIGKTAPNLLLRDKNNKVVELHKVQADYTVLYFWSPTCGHCKKATPNVVEFEKEFRDKGVKVISICGDVGKKANDCWKFIEEKQMQDFINLNDPYYKSRFKTKYYIRSTPVIFILNKNKQIISKKIGSEQLSDVMQRMIDAGE